MTRTKIEWTDRTWNPTRGCSRVSEGCRNCYAERMAARFRDVGKPFYDFIRTQPNGQAQWTGRVELIREKLYEPLHWRKPCRIFVNSMSDLFHEALPDEAIDRVFAVMAICPQHTFQVLTKRPGRMREWISKMQWAAGTPLPNLWLGVSVEDQKTADERIPILLQTPAAVRFASYEPALGPVDFIRFIPSYLPGGLYSRSQYPGPDWVICGGESGPGARPMHPLWARSIRDQCKAADVPFFFKQWGEWQPVDQSDEPTNQVSEHVFQDGTICLRLGQHAAGRLLDGREWNDMPEGRG